MQPTVQWTKVGKPGTDAVGAVQMGHDKEARRQQASDKKHLHITLGSKRSSDSEDVGWQTQEI